MPSLSPDSPELGPAGQKYMVVPIFVLRGAVVDPLRSAIHEFAV